jgi:hypothetical protein
MEAQSLFVPLRKKVFFGAVLCACVPGPLDELSAMVELRALAWFGRR